MKKFILSIVAVFAMALSMSAQTSNYAGTSKFTDNWSVTVQGGVITPMGSDFMGHVSPIIAVGADKYINPWLGVGIDARTAIAAPSGEANPHTMFDAVNVSGLAKFNLANIFAFNGSRRFFEPVIYTGLGWGHSTNSENYYKYWAIEKANLFYENGDNETVYYATPKRNYLTYVAGAELNFNLGERRDFAIVVNPAFKWGGIQNARLDKRNGHFEITAGLVYHFNTSNGRNMIAKHVAPAPVIREVVKEVPVIKEVTNTVIVPESQYAVTFDKNSAQLSNEAKAILDKVPTNSTVSVAGATSPEGTSARNATLAQERADIVAAYLKDRGVNVVSAEGGEAGRIAVVRVK